MTVYVFFWFDVEDYVTAESDVALGRLVDIFDRHSLKATFKMVGEKVRGLRRRGHETILAKLRNHDIGYHTDYHSKPPSIPEYELGLDWESGMREFMDREQDGLDTLKKAFLRTPSCYGQPGGSWAPQVYFALRQWGIPVYLDAGPWVRLDGRPHRYCGILDMLGLDSVLHMGIAGGPERVREQRTRVAEVVDRLRHTGGEVSLYAHECEFVTETFWDGINFGHGQDTPRERWLPAPVIPKAQQEARYAAMDEFLAFVGSLPDVEVVVASQAPVLYPDKARGRSFTAQQIVEACAGLADAITHQPCDGVWLSPAEIFGLTTSLLAGRVRTGAWPEQVPYKYLDGPSAPPGAEIVGDRFALDDVFGTCLYEDAYMELDRRLPNQVQIGKNWLAPADFLATIAASLPRWYKGDVEDAVLLSGNMAQAAYLPDHVAWDWVIFPPGFDADPLLELGKLQAWTLKPAPLA
jgi:hypothetical protein